MKILKINLFIFCCICAVIVSSCEKENEPISSTEDIVENRKRNNDFFSNRKTYERLGTTAHNWNKANQAFLRSEDEDIDELKDYVDNLDILLNDKYVNKIIADEGYPLWNASKVYLLDNGGSIVFTPIFKENSDKINAVFVYSNFGTSEVSYIMMTREEMDVIASNPKDPNFHLLNKIYKEFDNELFAFDSPQYDDWAELTLAIDLGCYMQIGIANDGLNDFNYVVCSSGCINDLWDSGIVNESEEISWIKGNCHHAATIDQYLEDNGISSLTLEVAETLLQIGVAEAMNGRDFRDLKEQIEIFLLNPNDISSIATLNEFLDGLGINVMSLDAFGLTYGYDAGASGIFTSWNDMNSGDYYSQSQTIKEELIFIHDEAEDYIVGQWACRVLGSAHEDATLTSLGLPLGNTAPNNGGFSKQPDGYLEITVYDYVSYQQPFFIEMKFKGTTGDFDYSNQSSQFNGYRNYLKNPLNTHKPYCSMAHGLYMILPANKRLTQSVIDACSADNIPLYYSGVEYNDDVPPLIRVKYPEFLNIGSIDYSCILFSFLGDYFFNFNVPYHLSKRFDYTGVNIEEFFDSYALSLEQTIINNQMDDCPFESDHH